MIFYNSKLDKLAVIVQTNSEAGLILLDCGYLDIISLTDWNEDWEPIGWV